MKSKVNPKISEEEYERVQRLIRLVRRSIRVGWLLFYCAILTLLVCLSSIIFRITGGYYTAQFLLLLFILGGLVCRIVCAVATGRLLAIKEKYARSGDNAEPVREDMDTN